MLTDEILPVCCQFISTHIYQFWSIKQNGVNFSGSTHRFYRFQFQVSSRQIAVTSSPVHPTSIHWIIRLERNAGVLLQAAIEAKNSSQVYRCTLADLVCLTGESHCQRCERQPQLTAGMCVTQWWKF